MAVPSDRGPTLQVKHGLIWGGAALVALGGLLCMAGGLAVTVAVIGATRSWVRQLEEPSRQLHAAG
jgi:hypothetical protein